MVEQTHSSNRKEEILNAAEQVFAKVGFDSARIEDIANLAGVAKGTIYLYFTSKQELFISLLENRFSEFTDLLDKGLANAGDAEGVLRVLVTTRVDFYLNHVGMIKLLFLTMGQLMDEVQPRMKKVKERIKQRSWQALEQVLPADYAVKPKALEIMVSGSVAQLIAESVEAKSEILPEEIADCIVNAFLPGIISCKADK